MRLLIMLFVIGIFTKATAQCDTVFNKRFVFDTTFLQNNGQSKALPLGSTLIVRSLAFDSIGKFNILFAVIDTCTGEVIHFADTIHPTSRFFFVEENIFTYANKVTSFGKLGNDSICQMIYDPIKNTIEYNTYPQRYIDTELYLGGISFTMTPDSGFLISYTLKSDTFYTQQFSFGLFRIDKFGTMQWHKAVSLPFLTKTLPTKIIPANGGGYYVSGWLLGQANQFSPYYNYPFIIKLNELGEILASYQDISSNWTSFGRYSSIIQSSDGSIIVAQTAFNQLQSPWLNRPQMVKFTPDLVPVWKSSLGNGTFSAYHGVHDIIEANEKDGYILAGGIQNMDDPNVWKHYGYIEKVNTSGKSVWLREVNGINITTQGELQVFKGIESTLSGSGYWLSGESLNHELPQPYAVNQWVVRVDNYGCDTLGCNGTVSIEQAVPYNVKKLKIYPNPSLGNQISLDLSPWKGQIDVLVYDLVGKVIFQQNNLAGGNEKSLYLNGLASGFYTLVVTQYGKRLAASPLLID